MIGGTVLHTLSTVLARIVGAPVHKLVAVCSGEPNFTVTLVVSVEILTVGSISTRSAVTWVNPALAVRASKPVGTNTGVVVDSVLTDPAIHAGAEGAVLVIRLTEGAAEAQRAGAGERVDIVCACCPVLAGVG